MLEKRRGADLLVDCLINQEVSKVFGVPGESFLGFLDAILENNKINWIKNIKDATTSDQFGLFQ